MLKWILLLAQKERFNNLLFQFQKISRVSGMYNVSHIVDQEHQDYRNMPQEAIEKPLNSLFQDYLFCLQIKVICYLIIFSLVLEPLHLYIILLEEIELCLWIFVLFICQNKHYTIFTIHDPLHNALMNVKNVHTEKVISNMKIANLVKQMQKLPNPK